jgi:hypothetical protein
MICFERLIETMKAWCHWIMPINNWKIEITLDLVWKKEGDVNKSWLTLNDANGELKSFPYIYALKKCEKWWDRAIVGSHKFVIKIKIVPWFV